MILSISIASENYKNFDFLQKCIYKAIKNTLELSLSFWDSSGSSRSALTLTCSFTCDENLLKDLVYQKIIKPFFFCKTQPVDESIFGNIVAILITPNVARGPRDFYSSPVECLIWFSKVFTVKDAVYAVALSWSQIKNTTLQKCWPSASDLTLHTDKEENHEDGLTIVLDVVRSADKPSMKYLKLS